MLLVLAVAPVLHAADPASPARVRPADPPPTPPGTSPVETAPAEAVSAEAIEYPPWLPTYDLDIALDTQGGHANVRQTVTWTNPATRPTNQLVFHVYPRYAPDKKMLQVYERTLESFRINPREGLDTVGRRLDVLSVTCGKEAVPFAFDAKVDTLMYVDLPHEVGPGQSVSVTIEFTIQLPPLQGRVGQFKCVSYLLNWYPILAYYSDCGWDNAPFVAWHQPWYNEAGHYRVHLRVPNCERVATGGQIVEEAELGDGTKRLEIVGHGLRDFAIVASQRFEIHEAEIDGVKVQVFAFPEHRFYASHILRTVAECLPQYNAWFGRYPHPELKIAESYFGWNGNETAGMVLIDARVFEAPHSGHRYIEHLVAHEVMHQWWYATVGTDGYREPWMDESLVSYLTEFRMKQKYGPDFEVIDWHRRATWLPNIPYNTLLHAGYYMYRGRGGNGRTLAPLQEIGHVHNLFFLVYDRGNKVVSMIHHRLGTERFFEFLKIIYAKYKFRVLHTDEFRQELEAFTGTSWKQFADDWLCSPKCTDWVLKNAHTVCDGGSYLTTVQVVQAGQIFEPVEIGWMGRLQGECDERVMLEPEAGDYDVGNASVRRIGPNQWSVTFCTASPPAQVVIDPEQWLLDANWKNNRWKPELAFRATPFYTPLDEMPIVRPIDKPSFVVGPGVDAEGRIVVRGSLMEPYQYRVSPFIAFTPEPMDNQLTAGVDAVYYNVPLPNVELGARYERTLSSELYDDPGNQGKLYARKNLIYTTSFIYPNLSYVEGYFRFGDNFFPDEDLRPPPPGVVDYRDVRAFGVAYHLDTRAPYWNPDHGFCLDAAYEHGALVFDDGAEYDRVWGQVSGVHRLPDWTGCYLSETKLAGRVAGGYGSPDNGEHFRFGGPLRFRGQRSEDQEGNAFWLASAEWRFPLWTELNLSLYDNLAAIRSIYSSVFYDVGEMYLDGDSPGVDHAVGAGLYFDMPLFSFVENFTLRMEVGHSLNNDTTILWVGWYFAL